jgi:hypothetical protein
MVPWGRCPAVTWPGAERDPARLRLAAIHTDLGERARAARRYHAIIRLWREPDPEFRPMIEEARRRKESLRVE